MIVYRVEDDRGLGPYLGAVTPFLDASPVDHRPLPQDIDPQSVFGFTKLEDAISWFGDAWDKFIDTDFTINKYEVANLTYRDYYQVAFRKFGAKLLDKIPMQSICISGNAYGVLR